MKAADDKSQPGGGRTFNNRVRSWDDMASRSIKLKLGAFPASQVEKNKDANGEYVHALVVRELQLLRPVRKHIPLSFWEKVIKRFSLHGGFASALDCPTEEQNVGKELKVALAAAHCSNPAQKSSAQLVRWLQYSSAPNHTELRGLLVGSVESPSMSRSMSLSILEHVLRFVARTKCDTAFPLVWQETKHFFDGLLVTQWQKMQSKGTTRSQYLRAWREPLKMFMDMEYACAVIAAEDNSEALDENKVETLVASSLIGAELFCKESSRCEVKAYVQDVEKRLLELENQDFSQDEVEAFKTLCMAGANQLDDETWTVCVEDKVEVTMLCARLMLPQVNPNDQWSFRLEAKIRTLAISTNVLKILCWESWVFGDSAPLPSISEHTKIDPALIFDAQNAREFLENKLEGKCHSIDSVKKTVNGHVTELLKLDRSFFLEIAFLNDHYDDLVETRMRDHMLECLPRPNERRSLAKAVIATRVLSTGPTTMAQRKSVQSDMVNAANCLLDISQGQSPSAVEVSSMSHWLFHFHKRAEGFEHLMAEKETQFSMPNKVSLFGCEAMRFRYHRCAALPNGHQSQEDMKEFKMFKWTLAPEEWKKVDEWQACQVLSAKDKIMNRQKALKDLEEKTKIEKQRCKDNNVESALVLAPPLKQREKAHAICKATDGAIEEAEKVDCAIEEPEKEDIGVMAFFGAKAL